MKSIFTFLLTGLMAVSAWAADVTGRITVSFEGSRDYQVLIDGRSYYSSNNRIYLNDMRPGRHSIQVYEVRNNNRRASRPVYANNFTVRPQYDMHILVDRNGYVEFEERRAGYNRRGINDRDYRDNRGPDDRDRDYRNDRDYNRNNNRYDRDVDYNRYNQAMSDYDYNAFVQKIRSQWLGNGKFNTAKEGLARYYFTTSQVKGILQQFSSENDRLDLAKLAYRNTVDSRNYSQLYDLFSRNAQRELDDYTRDYR